MSFGLVFGAFFGAAAGFSDEAAAVFENLDEDGKLDLGLGFELGREEEGADGQSRDQWPGRPHLKQPVGAAAAIAALDSIGCGWVDLWSLELNWGDKIGANLLFQRMRWLLGLISALYWDGYFLLGRLFTL